MIRFLYYSTESRSQLTFKKIRSKLSLCISVSIGSEFSITLQTNDSLSNELNRYREM